MIEWLVAILLYSATPAFMISFIAHRYWISTYRNYRNHDTGNPFERTPSTVSRVRCVDRMVETRHPKSPVVAGFNYRNEAAPIPVQKMWPDPPVQWTASPPTWTAYPPAPDD